MGDAHCTRVFDVGVRSDMGPARHGEWHSLYLNRSARPQFVAARELVEDWFGRLCPDLRPSVWRRLRRDDEAFASALWELYLHEMLVQLGYTIRCEPPLPNSRRRIDFLVSRGDSSFYLEATISRRSDAERGADGRRNRIYKAIDRIHSDSFTLGIDIEAAGTSDLPKVGVLCRRLEEWLAGLDPDEAQALWNETGDGPTLRWNGEAGWSLVFTAFPSKPEFRGVPVDRPLGMFSDETGGMIDDHGPLHRALRRKRPGPYGALDWPYVIAVNEHPFIAGDEEWHRMGVLYGSSAVKYGGGQGVRSVRLNDGFWRGLRGIPRNKRVSAVLFTSDLLPWNVENAQLEWWDNPFAISPMPTPLVPGTCRRRQLVLRGSEGQMVTTPPTQDWLRDRL